MNKAWLLAIIPGGIALMVGLFVVALLVVKLLWAWVVPDLFPGAVEQGLVARSISWYTALKVAIVIAILGGIIGGESHQSKSE